MYCTYLRAVFNWVSQIINNSSSSNKGNHDRDCVGISDLRFLPFKFSVFSLVLVSIEKIYQTLRAVSDHILKHLNFRQKIFRCASYFRFCSRCLDFVFDILRRETKTIIRVITLANRIGQRHSYEPIKTQSKYMCSGKSVRTSHDWVWFYFLMKWNFRLLWKQV